MAKMTLLEIVQDMLNDLNGDEVNSIDDTIEATQMAFIVRSTFRAMMGNRDWPHTRQLLQLTASGDPLLPTHMTFDTAVKRVENIKYDKIASGETKKKYTDVKYLEPDDFLRVLNNRDSTASTIDTVTDATGVDLLIKNDVGPTYYTSFDDETLVFDSYDSAVENTLITSKTQAIAYVTPGFTLSDTFTPDLPEESFAKLLEESKNRAAIKLRQIVDGSAASESQKQDRWLSQNAWTVAGGIKFPNYGRRSKLTRDPTFQRER